MNGGDHVVLATYNNDCAVCEPVNPFIHSYIHNRGSRCNNKNIECSSLWSFCYFGSNKHLFTKHVELTGMRHGSFFGEDRKITCVLLIIFNWHISLSPFVSNEIVRMKTFVILRLTVKCVPRDVVHKKIVTILSQITSYVTTMVVQSL